MSANLRNYIKAIYGLDHVMRTVSGVAWDKSSPCDDWTARDVAGHAMGVVEMVGAQAGASTAPRDFMNNPGDIAGTDPYASWYAIKESTLEALDHSGALQRMCRTPGGEQTVDAFLGFIVADTLIHTWDLARAVGGDERLDEQLVAVAMANLAPRAAGLADTGRFKPTVAVGGSASAQAKLLAVTGRRP